MNGSPANEVLVYVQLGEYLVSIGLHAWQGIRDMLNLDDPALAARVALIDQEIEGRIAKAKAAAAGDPPPG